MTGSVCRSTTRSPTTSCSRRSRACARVLFGPGQRRGLHRGPGGVHRPDRFRRRLRFAGMRIASPLGERFDYVLGLYYLDQEVDGRGVARVFARALVPTAPPVYVTATYDATVETTQLAAFAHGNFKLSEQWSLTGGIRFTDEDKDLSYRSTDQSGLFTNGQASTAVPRATGRRRLASTGRRRRSARLRELRRGLQERRLEYRLHQQPGGPAVRRGAGEGGRARSQEQFVANRLRSTRPSSSRGTTTSRCSRSRSCRTAVPR